MDAAKFSFRRLGIKYGLLTGLGFVIYFLIMRALGLVHITELRFMSYLLIPVALWLALRDYNKTFHHHRVSYLGGLGAGFWLTFISSGIFAVFMYYYCEFFEPGFVDYMSNYLPFQDYLNSFMMASAAFGEPLILGVVLSFAVMQLFKRNAPDIPEEQEEAEEHYHSEAMETSKYSGHRT